MSTATGVDVVQAAGTQKGWMRWTGYVLSALPVLAMGMSAAMKFAHPPQFEAMFQTLGWATPAMPRLGLLESACVLLYLLPNTSALGAVLMTGYLGGAVATHLRVGQASGALTPLLLGIFAWGGLFLRDERLRGLLPIRRPAGR